MPRRQQCRSRSRRLPPGPRPSGWVEPPGAAPDGAARAPREACPAESAALSQCLPPRARALPARTFRPEINGPAASGSPARGGVAVTHSAPREVTFGLTDYAVLSMRNLVLKRLTSSQPGFPALLYVLSFPTICTTGQPAKTHKALSSVGTDLGQPLPAGLTPSTSSHRLCCLCPYPA